MDSIEIRSATEEEREWAAELMADSDPWITLGRGLEQCRTACSQPDRMLFVAHSGTKPCGFILLQRRGIAGSPYIQSIAVAPDHRSEGIGGRLLQFAEDLFRSESKHIFLCVSSFNTRARALYERHGYAAVGEFKDYIIRGASEILMHKRLREP
jgi:ribosomal-protein-alanine N-acetyltransferase